MPLQKKWCPRCQRHKLLACFGRNRASHDGRTSYCRLCKQGYQRALRSETQLASERRYQLRKLYGITLEEYDAMFEAQGGVCAICSKPPGWMFLDVDHCHVTDRVRGLLCRGCNHKISAFERHPEWLERALSYLGARTSGPVAMC